MALNKSELVKAVAQKMNENGTKTSQKLAREFLDAFSDVLIEAVQENGGVELSGIFKIDVRDVEARVKRNPRTGETVYKEASRKVRVRPMSRLKSALQ